MTTYNNVFAPRCYVDIYPFEGGKYTLTGDSAGLIACSIVKGIDANPGTFTLTLAPGGPRGPNTSPQWPQLITPMSLVLIGMQRGIHKQIVMVGVAIQISTSQAFAPLRPVQRAITVQGVDFQYFFNQRSYYALTYLAMSVGAGLSALALPSLISGDSGVLAGGLLQGTPDSIGATWYEIVMAGTGGVLSQTRFAYKDGMNPKFPDVMARFFEAYPTAMNAKIGIPFSEYFAAEETWMAKFLKAFPPPMYEFFIMTAPVDYYSEYGKTVATSPGGSEYKAVNATTALQMDGFDPVQPTLVARVNPLPWSENQGLATKTQINMQMNFDRWHALHTFILDEGGTIAQEIHFDDSEVRNFYILNPLYTPLMSGRINSNIVPFVFEFASWADPGSIQRYGFRAQINELPWFADPKGIQAQKLPTFEQVSALVANAALKQTSYYHPTPLMAKATVTCPLRPDIIAGNRFAFTPYKDGITWMFYINAVTHNYQFGGNSTTTLYLTRGLPLTVYDDPLLMLAIHMGQAMRKDGGYAYNTATGVLGLTAFNAETMQKMYGDITAHVFQTPQGQ